MIILLNRCGQLANRLFMFSNFIALAQKNNLRITNLAFFEFERHFAQTSQDLFCRYPVTKFGFIKHRELGYLIYLSFFYLFKFINKFNPFKKYLVVIDLDKDSIKITPHECDEKILRVAKSGIVIILHGWLEVFSKLNSCQAKTIKNYFAINDIHKKNVSLTIEKARQLGQILVGVHVRHGDYKRFRQGEYFYAFETYISLLGRIQNLFQNSKVTFLICSNEKQDFKKLGNLKYVFGTGHRVEDLYALACCDYLIGPPSTYTMWASFYGQVPLYMVENVEYKFKLEDFKIFCPDENE